MLNRLFSTSIITFVTFASTFVFGILSARFTDPAIIGEVAVTIAVVEVLAIIADFTFGNIVVQNKLYSERVLVRNSNFLNYSISFIFLLLGVALFLFTPLVEVGIETFAIILFGKMLAMAFGVGSALLVKDIRYDKVALIDCVLAVISLPLLFLIYGNESESFATVILAIRYLISKTNNFICGVFAGSSRSFAFCYSVDIIKFLFSKGVHLLLSSSVSRLKMQVDKLIVSNFASSYDLGLYTRGVNFTQAAINLEVTILKNFVLGVFSSDKENISFEKTTILLLVANVIISIILYFLSPFIITYLLGDSWLEATYYMQASCFLIPSTVILNIMKTYITSQGRYSVLSKLSILELICFVGFSMLLVSTLGVIGIILSGVVIATTYSSYLYIFQFEISRGGKVLFFIINSLSLWFVLGTLFF